MGVRDKSLHKSILTLLFFIFIVTNLLFSSITYYLAAGEPLIPSESSKYGGTFTSLSYADISILNPLLSSYSTDTEINDLIFESMVIYDKDMRIVPNLAYNWEVSTDRLDYTFHLREDVFWHDGEQFTADDVIFTWDRILDPESKIPKRLRVFNEYLAVNTTPYARVDDFTVIFHLRTAHSNFLPFFIQAIIPEHTYQNHVGVDNIPHTADDCRNSEGEYTFNNDPRNTASTGKKPIGTGCMMFQEWELDDHVILIRNSKDNGGPGYWNCHDAYLDRYILRVSSFIHNGIIRPPGWEYNGISIIDLSATPLEDIEDLAASHDYNVFNSPVFTSDHIAFQCDPNKGNLYGQQERDFEVNPNHFAGFKWQTDQYPQLNIYGYKIRQALNYGLNKMKIIKIAYPIGYRNLGPMYRAQIGWYNEDVNPYTYNITKANQLLGEAGFGYTAEDQRRKTLNFTLSFNQGNYRRQRICQEAVQQWSNLGLSVEIEQLDWVSMIASHYAHRNFDAISGGWTGGGEDPDFSNIWHSRNIRLGSQPISITQNGTWMWNADGKAGGLNYMSYWNPLVNKLMEVARTEPDKQIQKMYYDLIQQLIVEDSAYIWILNQAHCVAVESTFHGFVNNSVAGLWPAPIGFHNIYYHRQEISSRSSVTPDNTITGGNSINPIGDFLEFIEFFIDQVQQFDAISFIAHLQLIDLIILMVMVLTVFNISILINLLRNYMKYRIKLKKD